MEQYHQITLTEWAEVKARLRRAALNAANGFVELGYELRMIEEQELYRAGGYKSIAEFAESEPEFGLNASMVSRLININRNFADAEDPKRLKLEYTKMGMSKLSEMLNIPMEDREMIRPETKREDIRELKRLEKQPEEESDLEKIIRLFFGEFEDLLRDLRQSKEYAEGDMTGMVEIIAPSGSRSYRKNGMMLMMYEEYIKYKAAGHSPETVKWSEFFEIADRIEVIDECEETESEAVEETDEESDQGTGIEETTDEIREDDAEADESQVEADKNDVGGKENEENNDETVEEDEAESPEEASDAKEAAPVEEPEEKFGGMNPPVDNSEIAPAQLDEKSAERQNENGNEVIVDEAGNPAPEEDSGAEILSKVQKERLKAVKMLGDLERDIDKRSWKTAREKAEKLLGVLKYLENNDIEARR